MVGQVSGRKIWELEIFQEMNVRKRRNSGIPFHDAGEVIVSSISLAHQPSQKMSKSSHNFILHHFVVQKNFVRAIFKQLLNNALWVQEICWHTNLNQLQKICTPQLCPFFLNMSESSRGISINHSINSKFLSSFCIYFVPSKRNFFMSPPHHFIEKYVQ